MSSHTTRACGSAPHRACALDDQRWRVCLFLPRGASLDAVPSPLWDLTAIVVKSYELMASSDSDGRTGAGRGLRLCVPVEHPRLWSSPEVLAEVRFILRSYWGKRFDLELTPAGDDALICRGVAEQELSPGLAEPGAARIMAFSAELDAMAAAIQELASHSDRVVLVTLESSLNGLAWRSAAQRLVEDIRGHRVARAVALLPEAMLRAFSAADRRLVHVVLTALVSLSAGGVAARFYENGVDNLRLPATACAMTRSLISPLHPDIVGSLNDVITRIASSRFRIENPFLTRTPAEIVEELVTACGPEVIEVVLRLQDDAADRQARRVDQHISALGAVLAGAPSTGDHEAFFLRELVEPMNENIAASYVHLLRELPALPDHELVREFVEGGWDSGGQLDSALVTNLFRRHTETVRHVLMRGIRHYAQEIAAGVLPPMCLIARAAMPRQDQDASSERPQATFRKRSDRWELWYESGEILYLNDSKGMLYLHVLLQHPERVYSAADLRFLDAGAGDAPMHLGNAGELVDRQAISAYRQRLSVLHGQLDIANENNDLGRMQRARQEIDALEAELRRCLGRSGQSRVQSDSERARKAVSIAIRRALARIRAGNPALAGHLESSLQVGAYLCYRPQSTISWRL